MQSIVELETQKAQLTPTLLAFLNNGDLNVSREKLRESLYLKAKVFYDKADLLRAEQLFKEAYALSNYPRDIFSMLKILGFQIRIASEKLADQEALELIAKSEDLVEKMPQVLGSLNAEYFYNLANVKTYRGDFIMAEESYLLACKKAKEENEAELLAKCLLALATTKFKLKQYAKAMEYINQLEDLLMIVNKAYIRGAMSLLAAKVNKELGEINKAHEYFKQSMSYLKDKKCWNLLGYVLLSKGNLYKKNGDFSTAKTYYELALDTSDTQAFARLSQILKLEINDVDDNSVDIYLDRNNRKISEKSLGTIDFKHRFILLEILFLLATDAGNYYDKEQLARAIWKHEYNPLIHDKLIYTSVSRLRKLIEPKIKTSKRKYIIRGKDGYAFNPDVKIRFQSNNVTQNESMIANVEISSPV